MTKSLLSIIILIICSSGFVFGQNETLKKDLNKSFKNFSVTRLNTQNLARQAQNSQIISFSSDARDFELRLTPRDLRSARYRAEDTFEGGVRILDRTPNKTFKGEIVGETGSQVRLTIDETKIEGYFVSGGEMFFIEPARDYSKSATNQDFVIYKRSDVLLADDFSCSSELMGEIENGREFVAPKIMSGLPELKVIELATEADFEFVGSTGGAVGANEKILSILNMVEGLYENELNLTIQINFQHTYSTFDPFNGASPESLVVSFKDFWNANYPLSQYPRDAAHLFSYKPNVRGKGYAYFDVVCSNPDFAYAVTGRYPPSEGWEEVNFFVAAHEIGHNLGADHSDGVSSCANTLMGQLITNSTQLSFCMFSRSEINTYLSNNGGCLTPQNNTSTPFDFDGDGKTDTSIFRPANGVWFIANSGNGGFNIFQFGLNGDKPVAGDYDGDGKSDAAVYRNGVWYRMLSATNTFDAISFGFATDIPTTADFDGDGKADVAVFRPSNGVWYRLNSTDGSFSAIQFGLNGDVPRVGDYDGDGKADINVFRPSNGVWYRLNSADGSSFATQFGTNGDLPVQGDYDGDGKADIAVWRPSNGVWYVQRSSNQTYLIVGFGLAGDVPLSGDYDGDGKSDIAVWRPSNGVWHRLSSASGGYTAYQFGIGTDLAVPAN